MLDGEINSMIRESSRMAVMKVSSIPDTSPLKDKGTMILKIRFNQPIPCTLAVSSKDLSICSMAEIPVRDVNGRFFTTVISTRIAKVPYRAGIGPHEVENIPM